MSNITTNRKGSSLYFRPESRKVALMALVAQLCCSATTTDAFLVPGCHRHPSGLHSIISRSTRTKRSKRTRSHNNLHPHHTFSFARIKTKTKPVTRQHQNGLEGCDYYDNGSLFNEEDHNYGIVSVLEKYKEMEYKIIQDTPKDDTSKNGKSKKKSKPKKEPHQLLLAASAGADQQQSQQLQPPAWLLQFTTAQQQLSTQKRRVQQFIEEPIIEFASAALILLSSILVAVDTLPNLPIRFIHPLEIVQEILAYLFFVEFLTRWWSCTDDPKTFTPSSKKSSNGSRRRYKYYITQPLVLVDVIVVVLPLLLTTFPLLDTAFPDWLSGQSGLINLRLLRVLRLQRVLQDELIFSKFVYAINPYNNNNGMMKGSGAAIVQPWELQLARVVLSLFTLLSVAAGLIYTTEHLVNPDIDDYFTALYFTLTTLTTVGFGDITPVTWEGKLVVSGSILAGISIIPAQAASLVDSLLQRNEERQRLEREERETSTMLSAKRNANNNRESMKKAAMQASSSSRSMASTTSTSAGSSTSSSSRSGGGLASDVTLLHAAKCPNCKAGLHWSNAKFCYNCATALNTEESSLVLPDSYN